MKKFKKLSALFLSVLLLLSCMTITAYAAQSAAQDGLSAVIETDKESYEANEPILVTVTVTNTNSFAMKNVSIESILPAELTISEGTLKSDTVDLEAGEKLTLTFTAVLEKEVPPVTEPGTSEPDTSEPGTSDSDKPGESSGILGIILKVLGFIALIVAAILSIFTITKKTTSIISIVLSAAIGISAFATTGIIAKAAQNTHSFSVDKTITVDGEQAQIIGNIAYDYEENHMSLSIDQQDFETQTSKTSLSGKIEGATKDCIIEYRLYAEIDDYEESFTGTATIKDTNWAMNEVFLKSGNNKIVITAQSEKQSVSKIINIYYDMGELYKPDQSDIAYDEEKDLHYVDDIVLILFNDDVSDERKDEIVQEINGKIVGRTDFFYQVQVTSSSYTALLNICNQLLQYSEVFYASPDLADQLDTNSMYVPNDPWTEDATQGWSENSPDGHNWGVEAIQATSAWNYNERFNHINVAVVDNGFDLDHQDLKGVFKPSSILAKNQNDYRDIDEKGNTYNNSHGTHVSGIIGAKANNKKGITGLLWDTTIYYTDWQPYSKEQSWNTQSSILYSLGASVISGAKVINYSLGKSFKIDNTSFQNAYDGDLTKLNASQEWKNGQARLASATMSQLLEQHYDFVVVQSAGNGAKVEVEPGEDMENVAIDATNNGFWASVTEDNVYAPNDTLKKEILNRIIVVGAVQRNADGNYQQCVFSNGGERVDICAPGFDIYSTTVDSHYEAGWSGTSMAAPYVTGVCGMVWSVNPEFTGAEVKAIVCDAKNTTEKVYDNPDYYHPLFNEYRMVNARLTVEEAIRRTDNQGVVTGTVEDKVTGATVSDVSIKIIDNSFNNYVTVATTTTNGNGSFSLRLPEGDYSVSFSHPDYLYQGMSFSVRKDVTTVLDSVLLLPKNLADAEFAGGDGSVENPYQIATARQLDAVRNHLNSNFVLVNDIDLSEYSNWVPIGGYVNLKQNGGLHGSFDGQGHTIYNLNMNYTINPDKEGTVDYPDYYFGLFSRSPWSAGIKNVHLKNVNIDISCKEGCEELYFVHIGGLASTASVIQNVTVSGDISASLNGHYFSGIGGIVGVVDEMKDCQNYADVHVAFSADVSPYNDPIVYLGGVAAMLTQDAILNNCTNYGKISGETEAMFPEAYEATCVVCGGIAASGTSLQINNCRNYGNIESCSDSMSRAGGIISNFTSGTIEHCVNYANVRAVSSKAGAYAETKNHVSAGGISAASTYGLKADKSIKSCVNFGNLSVTSKELSKAFCGGILGYNYEMSSHNRNIIIENCYNLSNRIDVISEFPEIYIGRISAQTTKEVDNGATTTVLNSYAVDSTLLNGVPAAEYIGSDQKNGGSMSRAEIEKAVTDLGFELPA